MENRATELNTSIDAQLSNWRTKRIEHGSHSYSAIT